MQCEVIWATDKKFWFIFFEWYKINGRYLIHFRLIFSHLWLEIKGRQEKTWCDLIPKHDIQIQCYFSVTWCKKMPFFFLPTSQILVTRVWFHYESRCSWRFHERVACAAIVINASSAPGNRMELSCVHINMDRLGDV